MFGPLGICLLCDFLVPERSFVKKIPALFKCFPLTFFKDLESLAEMKTPSPFLCAGLVGFETQVPNRAIRIASPNRADRACKSKFQDAIANHIHKSQCENIICAMKMDQDAQNLNKKVQIAILNFWPKSRTS